MSASLAGSLVGVSLFFLTLWALCVSGCTEPSCASDSLVSLCSQVVERAEQRAFHPRAGGGAPRGGGGCVLA